MELFTSYKATDGTLHVDATACAVYDLELVFQKIRPPGKREDGLHGNPVTVNQVLTLLLNDINGKQVIFDWVTAMSKGEAP